MIQTAVIRLVKSLSKSEKRHFRMEAAKQGGQKDYLSLFDIIDRCVDMDSVAEKFRGMHPKSSLDNTSRYLLRLITDCLIQCRIKEDRLFQMHHGLMRVHILSERNLPEEGYRELKKLEGLAAQSENFLLQYLVYRQELNYLADNNFREISEKQVIETQMKARDLIRELRNAHEHYSLYELLKYRLIYSGKALSEEDRKHLNDLLLSEMSIVNAKVRHNLESRKLHLLFQSFFFTDIGDYKSALKTFHELNRLFEKNRASWRHPPFDYLSSLDGILDSLRTIGYYGEMSYYLRKLEQLDDAIYPEYYRRSVRITLTIYRLVLLLAQYRYEMALQVVQEMDPQLLGGVGLTGDDKQAELLFCYALAYYKVGEMKKAIKYLQDIGMTGRGNPNSMIGKASRLLSILIVYEEKDLDYLEYVVRSYKRAPGNRQKPLQTEKVIFKTIKFNPDFHGAVKKELFWKKLAPLIQVIEKDKYEQQLRKHFDFTGWIRERFEDPPGPH